MKNVLIILAIIFLSGCTVFKKSIKETTKSDSVRIEYREKTVYKDSLVETVIPADSAYIKMYWECDSLGQLHIREIDQLQSQKAKVKVEVRDDYILSTCICDSSLIYAMYRERYEMVEIVNDVVRDTSTSNIQKKSVMPWWVFPGFILVWIFGALVGYLVSKFT